MIYVDGWCIKRNAIIYRGDDRPFITTREPYTVWAIPISGTNITVWVTALPWKIQMGTVNCWRNGMNKKLMRLRLWWMSAMNWSYLILIAAGSFINVSSEIYARLDSVDEVSRPEMWPKANPNIGKTVTYETYQLDVPWSFAIDIGRISNKEPVRKFSIPFLVEANFVRFALEYEPSADGHGGHYVNKTVKKLLINKQHLIVGRGAAKSVYDSCIQSSP